jgi:FMN-dependent NADH-azoreductase
MPTLLHIDSSPRSASVSSRLAAAFVERWRQQNPGGTVLHRNTAIEEIPYLDEAAVDAFFTPREELTAKQERILTYSDRLVDELLAADVLVLGVPMWNLGIPASLKAWIDQIVRLGRTFAFTETGVASLLPPGKKAYVFTARGGTYPAASPYKAYDQLEPYLRAILGFLGLASVEFVNAECQSAGPEAAAKAVAHAEAELAALIG